MPGQLYPLFLSLEGFSVLIIGFGSVGRRKLAMLIPAAPASVTIIDPRGPDGESGELIKSAGEAGISVRIFPGPFVDNMLEDVQLVYTCAGDHALNARVAGLCRERRIFCNCTDNPPLGSLHVPAAARRGTLCCALSTGGASPALARRWKKELEAWLARKERITDLMAALRPLVLSLGWPSDQNRDIFRSLSDRCLEDALADDHWEQAASLLNARLPQELRSHTEELLHALHPLS